MPKLDDYKKLLVGKECRWCKEGVAELKEAVQVSVLLDAQPVRHFVHQQAGFVIDEMRERQWLYVKCPRCGYHWSFLELGIEEIKPIG
jgi:hypothetical protein